MTAPTISATAGGAHRSDADAVTAEHSTSSTATTSAPVSRDPDLSEDTPSGGVPVVKVVLFLVGCVLLVLAAANLSNLGQWSDRWGVIPVFLAFFLVMSIAGRWFWTGADAILGALMWGKTR
ncbi:hypothetical protein QNM97_10435 [Gordonia sp. L191]|uniref:hypothetical protein n=1 Tax=Gordonia sp. L191 TaxID=2982699 RepID=UPI0024BFAF0B|nr:hypothetical protein [Gordonia sp. L191]WHU49350.1 hypothetical protein QNM97_10435 [Gordonia sp. L191]